MAKARQQLSGSPLQEVVEGVSGSLLHPDLIPVVPDLQTRQRNADVQGTVELKRSEERRSALHPQRRLTSVPGGQGCVCALTQSTWLATSSMR